MAFRNLKSRLPRKILRKVSRKFLNDYAIRLWRKWEKELVCESTTITVSDEIAENLRAMDNNLSPNRIFVVPNFPLRTEVKNFEKPQYHSSSCVYAGLSGRVQTTPAHTNIDGLAEAFSNSNIGQLTIIGWDDKSVTNSTVFWLSFEGVHVQRDVYTFNRVNSFEKTLVPFLCQS